VLKAVVVSLLFVAVVLLPVWLVDHAGEGLEIFGVVGYLFLFGVLLRIMV